MVEEKSKKRVLLVGASPNPSRYAYTAAKMFQDRGFEFIPIGINKGEVQGKTILNLREKPDLIAIDTITLYISSDHQEEWIDYLLGLKPNRIIFNPGAENPDFARKAKANGIVVLNACNLVMLSTGQF
jgi:hypothetical protein